MVKYFDSISQQIQLNFKRHQTCTVRVSLAPVLKFKQTWKDWVSVFISEGIKEG